MLSRPPRCLEGKMRNNGTWRLCSYLPGFPERQMLKAHPATCRGGTLGVRGGPRVTGSQPQHHGPESQARAPTQHPFTESDPRLSSPARDQAGTCQRAHVAVPLKPPCLPNPPGLSTKYLPVNPPKSPCGLCKALCYSWFCRHSTVSFTLKMGVGKGETC